MQRSMWITLAAVGCVQAASGQTITYDTFPRYRFWDVESVHPEDGSMVTGGSPGYGDELGYYRETFGDSFLPVVWPGIQESVFGTEGLGGGSTFYIGRTGPGFIQLRSSMIVTFAIEAPLPYYLTQVNAQVRLTTFVGGETLVAEASGAVPEVSGIIGPGTYTLTAIGEAVILATDPPDWSSRFVRWTVAIPSAGSTALLGLAGLTFASRRRR